MEAYERIEKATAEASHAVHGISADQLSNATPCSEFDVRGLMNHVLGGLNMLAEAASGGKPAMPDGDLVGDGSDLAARYDTGRDKLLGIIKQDGVFDKTWSMPFGEMPGKMMAGIAFMEHLTHAWDLRKATGQAADLPGDLVAECTSVVTPMDAMLRMPGVCGPAVEPAAGASETDKLMAFLGRTP